MKIFVNMHKKIETYQAGDLPLKKLALYQFQFHYCKLKWLKTDRTLLEKFMNEALFSHA